MASQELWLFSAIILLLFIFILHFSIKILSWALHKKFGVKLKVGGYGFMCIRNIQIQLKNGIKLEIEYAGISSWLLNSNLKSLFVICINDIRIQGDTEVMKSRKETKEKSNESGPSFLPAKYIPLLKFISLNVSNASVMQLGRSDEEFLLHLSFQEFNLHFERLPERFLLNISVTSSTVKVFKHLSVDQENHDSTEACICHFTSNLNLSLEANFIESTKIQSLRVNISEPELMLYEGFSISKFKNYALNGKQSGKLETEEASKSETAKKDFKDLFEKLPQVLNATIDTFSVKLMMKGGNRTFSFGINFISLTVDVKPTSVTSEIQVKGVTAASDHMQFGQLISCVLHASACEKILTVNFNLCVLHVLYQAEVLQYFLSSLLSKQKTVKSASSPQVKSKTSIKDFLSGYVIKANADLDDVSISVEIPNCEVFCFGLLKGQSKIDHFVDEKSFLSFPSLYAHECGYEILLETAYLKLGSTIFKDFGVLKKNHHSCIPVSVGMVLTKVRKNQRDGCLQCMFDGCNLQWCPDSRQLVSFFLQYMQKNVSPKAENVVQPSPDSAVEEKKVSFSFELIFRSLNAFAFNDYKTGVLFRSDLLKLASMEEKAKVVMEGCKMIYLNCLPKIYHCPKSSEIQNYNVFVEDASLVYLYKTKEMTVRISENFHINWTTTLHMTLFSLYEEGLAFKKNSTVSSKQYEDNIDIENLDPLNATSSERTKTAKTVSMHIEAKGHLMIGLVLSKRHRIAFCSNDLILNFRKQFLSFNSDELVVAFDDHNIFTFEKIAVSLTPGPENHIVVRQGFDELELPDNRLLNIEFDTVKFVFPYKYNFAEAFSEEFININKWLKIVHKKKKVPFTLESKLPPDLHIACKAWIIELGDDPFEVKLRDNCELLEDEYHESLKRQVMLDEKCEIIRRTHLLISSEKINLLHSKLSKKNAEIYIKRSRQLYKKDPMRTSLCTWVLEDIDILAIADTSYHGTERVVKRLQELDSESPYPEEDQEYTTLWARKVRCSVTSWTWQMRDFPQMPLNIRELCVFGFLIGAEQEASQRARRTSTVEIDSPWSNADIERSMPSLKFYHDLTFDMEEMSMAYGPSWEPVIAQISLAMENVSRPSLDPSPALPWWDKMRLLYHGRLTLISHHLILFLRASLDPYNVTEHMEISWSDVIIEWTNGKVLTKGDLDLYVHTASKYDDIRVLHIPKLKLSTNFKWLCLGNPYDHHNVMPCAPDKVPEYSINQEHDSYRAFRSQNLNITYNYETKESDRTSNDDVPTMLLYSSTLKWIENLKMILSGVTRLTRRGVLFSNTKPRKPQLSRHYNRLCISLNLDKFRIIYWMSFAMQRGLELIGSLSLSSEQILTLTNVDDGLKHRPRINWNVGYLNCELKDGEIWLYNCMDEENEGPSKSFNKSAERSYFLSVKRVSYGREEIVKDVVPEEDKEETPAHQLVVHDLKGAWTRHNRLVVFSLLDSYQKTVILKKNLSTEALRCFKVESQNTPQKLRSQTNSSISSASASPNTAISNLQSSHAVSMLQKLVAESEANSVVFTEEIEGTTREQQLHGITACQTDDVLQKKWLIELVNSQVMLKGCETSGYVIVSAAKAKILQRLHAPVWKDRSLVSKTTWVGSFECMQYYATVNAGVPSPSVDNVMWLSVDNIEEKESMVISDIPDLVGSGHSVGGVVSNTVGAISNPESAPMQLQRIVSRCGCQFFFACYGENMDPSNLEEVPPLPEDDNLWEQEVAVDSFTLTHHDLDICTNSLQYAMILDVVNNLLLYVEPRKKEATNKLQYMRFQLQLRSVDDQRGPILQLQENIRSLVSNLRRLEREVYVIQKHRQENFDSEEYREKLSILDEKICEHKEQLNSLNEELTMMISCFKETQLIASKSRQRASSQGSGVTTSRRSEVCFKHAKWILTDADGQLGIAGLTLSNFLYSKVTKTDDSIEHLLEVSYVKMENLLPNQAYKIVLQPTELQTKIPLDRQCLLRIFCRERAPVGGISIKEHLEVNVVPITIGLTEAFYKAMLKFFFPGRDTEKADEEEEEQQVGTLKGKGKQKQSSMFYGERDDIEKMKERAEKNHTFFSIKIPEVPIRVSYKGKKDKNIEDVHELSLLLSTIEYHNKTWTWLDLLMALKNDAKKILLSQAIKQKLLKSRNIPEADNQPQEDEKAMILLGTQLAGQDKTLKRGFLSRIRKDHH